MYRRIGDYGIIGNMYSAALLSTDGSIDYCSMPFLDSPTVFAALLDDKKGGFWQIHPDVQCSYRQTYLENTNVLQNEFISEIARAALISFMPVHNHEPERLQSIRQILRQTEGSFHYIVDLAPRPSYASRIPRIIQNNNRIQFEASRENFFFTFEIETQHTCTVEDDRVRLTFTLPPGRSAYFAFSYDSPRTLADSENMLERNITFWQDWIKTAKGIEHLSPEYQQLAARSVLALKLLQFAPNGSIAAAPTTSLPEAIGGDRNWDYRLSWLRDSSYALKALFAVNLYEEAKQFELWLYNIFDKRTSDEISTLYTLQGSSSAEERSLSQLEGYSGSAPVRIGNAASKQLQNDIYGEVLDAALTISQGLVRIEKTMWPFYLDVCEKAIEKWDQPDCGIWEMRKRPSHFTFSKVMCWAAMDRAIRLAQRFNLPAPLEKFKSYRTQIKQEILSKGYDPTLNSFVLSYGDHHLDAALLRMAGIGFLPAHDRRIIGTIKACQRTLMQDGFLRRYNVPDGFACAEGTFIPCNFWLVEALISIGRRRQAEETLAVTCRAANHLGLFSEEYDPAANELLGNFPQALSHIGFLNAALAISGSRSQFCPLTSKM